MNRLITWNHGGEGGTREIMGQRKGNNKVKKRNDIKFMIIRIHINLFMHMKNILKVYKQEKTSETNYRSMKSPSLMN